MAGPSEDDLWRHPQGGRVHFQLTVIAMKRLSREETSIATLTEATAVAFPHPADDADAIAWATDCALPPLEFAEACVKPGEHRSGVFRLWSRVLNVQGGMADVKRDG